MALFGERLGPFAGQVTWHLELSSTNDAALLLADHGASEGTVVGADAQTAGRGRQGRHWSSPAGAGLYVSAIFRPPDAVAALLTVAAGVALAEGIEAATGLNVALKWPNDVYVGPRKLAGILAEAGASPSRISHVVVGFGINLIPASYPPEVATRATSLEAELGRSVDRGLVLAACLAALATRYEELVRGDRLGVIDSWRRYARPMLGRRVSCTIGGRAVEGIAENIDNDGALVVSTSAGVVRVISGEVSWF